MNSPHTPQLGSLRAPRGAEVRDGIDSCLTPPPMRTEAYRIGGWAKQASHELPRFELTSPANPVWKMDPELWASSEYEAVVEPEPEDEPTLVVDREALEWGGSEDVTNVRRPLPPPSAPRKSAPRSAPHPPPVRIHQPAL